MARRFTASEKMKPEYCAQVVKIGKLQPIEGSDFLVKTLVGGFTMVVRKDEIKEGDYVIYCKNETMLNPEYLSVNNLYELSEYEKNANHEEVSELKQQLSELKHLAEPTESELETMLELENKIKSKCGFFNKHGRVKTIKLRGVHSFGFIIKLDSLAKWKPEVITEDLSKYILNEEMGIGMDFDTVCGEEFIKVYMPPIKSRRQQQTGRSKNEKLLAKFERIDKKDWQFHYDSQQLNSNIWKIQPTDVVDITVKVHGTSFCGGNIPVKNPRKLNICQKFINWLCKKVEKLYLWLKDKETPTYTIDYGNVYSSRTVIKNQNINPKASNGGFYGDNDVWGTVNEWIKPYIEKGMMIYGEIYGYLPESNSMIQKEYDYGCNVGECEFMPYRITTTNEDGTKKEWEIQEVYDWTVNLIKEHPELEGKVKPITLLYHGTLQDLYPHLDVNQHWHENVLEEMKKDKKHFGMEKNEPMCKSFKVPREGICVRKVEDEYPECFKLKTEKFYSREKSAIDKGEVDNEMTEGYDDNQDN